MRTIFLLILLMIPYFLFGSVGITFTFDSGSGMITYENGKSYYEFDVYVKASEEGSRLGLGIVLLHYNTNAFGDWIKSNNKVSVTKGSLINSPFYTLILNDNRPSIFAVTFDFPYNLPGYGSPLPTTPAHLLHYKIEIADKNQSTGLSFSSEMIGQQFTDNSILYDPVIVTDTFNDTLPVELSSFTAQTSIDNFVNLMWITQTETGVQGFYVYRGVTDVLSDALQISPLIPATNTSQMQCYIYKDTEIYDEGTYCYWLQNADLDGTNQFHGPISFYYAPVGSLAPQIPLQTGLQTLYPNPFNPDLRIAYSLEKGESVMIQVYNLKGQLIDTLVDGYKDSGNHNCIWNAFASDGRRCSSGMYLVKMTVGSRTHTKKVMLMK